MKRIIPPIVMLVIIMTNAFSQDACGPIGWAAYDGSTIGGGTATPVVVTNFADFKIQVESNSPKVIYIEGTIGSGVSDRVTVKSDKTIFGQPGAKLIGGMDIKDANNVIVRNLKIQGPGAVDVDGVDCITIQNSTRVWCDHLEVYDGQDGNLDIVNGSNYVTITWCKFYYTGASQNHQFCNLIGNSTNKISDRDKLKVTMQYNWWTDGVKERMPRVRYGQVHVVNNLYDSENASNCIRAGREADLLIESNVFRGVNKPIDLYNNDFTGVTARNNSFISTSGNTNGSGTSFTAPYNLQITSVSEVEALVKSGAGPTLSSPNDCGSNDNTPPAISVSSPSNGTQFTSPATIIIQVDASDVDGQVVKIEYFEGNNKLGEGVSHTWTGVAEGNYIITVVATDDDGAQTVSSPVSVQVGADVVYDCNGDENGSAYYDGCGECVGGNTGKDACISTCDVVGAQYGLIGFGNTNGSTTGGAGGDEVIVTNGTDLQNAIKEADGPRIIYVNGTITPSNSGSLSKIDIKDASDISIIGVGTSGDFDGIGIKVWRANNIIIQNVKVHHVLIGDKDAISIEGPSDHIWVDHCELYAELDGVGKDYYDGLLDMKRDVFDVTFSWNYLHDSWKASLSGSSETDNESRNVTYHHNRFENINSRLPLFRYGTGHVFNNYYKDVVSTGINSRLGACIRIENNVFENVHNPYVTAYSDVDGYGELINNSLINSPFEYASDTRMLPSCQANILYNYSGYLNCVEDVAFIVEEYSGVGKLNSVITSVSSEFTASQLEVFPNPTAGDVRISQSVKWQLLNLQGEVLSEGDGEELNVSELPTGTYFLKTPRIVIPIFKQ